MEWIKVSEQTPIEDNVFLVYWIGTDIGIQECFFDDGLFFSNDEAAMLNYGYDDAPTHWMVKPELPNPPKD